MKIKKVKEIKYFFIGLFIFLFASEKYIIKRLRGEINGN